MTNQHQTGFPANLAKPVKGKVSEIEMKTYSVAFVIKFASPTNHCFEEGFGGQ
jgi:hypothetical protein